MSQRQIDKRWNSRKAIHIQFHHGIRINNDEMVIKYQSDGHIYKYNTYKNDWIKIIRCPSNFYRGILFLDTASKKLHSAHYGSGKLSQKLMLTSYDIKNNRYTLRRYGPFANTLSGIIPYLCHVDGNIHIIGGHICSTHHVWNFNKKRNEYKLIHQFKFDKQNLMYLSLVHVPSKQMILMIGGSDIHNYDKRNYSEEDKRRRIGIWKFCLISQKWTKLQFVGTDFKQANVRCALSSNEDFVIIAGGWDNIMEESDEIFVLDLRDNNQYKLRKSEIKCPQKGKCGLVTLGGGIQDELLVIGWIKDLFKTINFKHLSLPPMYLIKLIQSWYNQEMIHWLQPQEHYSIKLKDVL